MFDFFRRKYRTLNTIEVSKSALLSNLKLYQKLAGGQKVCPVLKSNAYGHGLEIVGKILEPGNPPFLIVDSLYEAQKLQRVGIRAPILILGPTFPENLPKRSRFHHCAQDLESARALAKLKVPVHVEVDTGMSRMGFSMEELPNALKEMRAMDLRMEGLFTHLADADNTQDPHFTKRQSDRFRKALQLTLEAGFNPQWIHVNNSAGASTLEMPELNMMRLGIGLYGLSPVEDPRLQGLQQALTVKSTLIAIRTLKKGEPVSYNSTFIAPRDMRIGTLPFGYYEGLPRSLSNLPPFLGRICMNHSIIEVTDAAKIGEEVILYGDLSEFAKKAGTIPYELMVRLSESIRRVPRVER